MKLTGWVIVMIVVISLLIYHAVFIVKEKEAIIIERFGRYHKTLASGFNVIIPFIDVPRQMFWIQNGLTMPVIRIDLRELIVDIQEQSVITNDNVRVIIDAFVFVQIKDTHKAMYNIQTLPLAISQLTQTSLRSLAGEMELDQTLSNRERINQDLKMVLDQASSHWGVEVKRVELKNITPPEEVQHAMEKQMQAERERRATVLKSEGLKQGEILKAQGVQQSLIAQSDGERQALIARADGEAKALERVAEARASALQIIKREIGSETVAYQMGMSYIEAFRQLSTDAESKVVFLPYEASSLLGSVGSLKELLHTSSSYPKNEKSTEEKKA